MISTAIVVGSGAGGATVARELVRHGVKVKILEAGAPFSPLNRRLLQVYPLARLGFLGTEKTITRFFPHLKTSRLSQDLVMVRGLTTGGSTTISCGNMVRADRGLREIGLDLSAEFKEIENLVGITTIPREKWTPITQQLFDAAFDLNLNPAPTPKALNIEKCISCGLCELGCQEEAKWDARSFLREIVGKGASLHTKNKVKNVIVEGGKVKGVETKTPNGTTKVFGDVVVLAAGGVGTAQILKASGIPTRDGLWIDLVVTLGGISEGAYQLKEAPMAWYAKKENYIISPYPDVLSVWFHKPWRKVPVKNRVGVMVKLADASNGKVLEDGSISKELTSGDIEELEKGLSITQRLMEKAGVGDPFLRGMFNGGHLGGTVPLDPGDVDSMKPQQLPEGLWVADLSLAPSSQGMPTMLLASALALRVARKMLEVC